MQPNFHPVDFVLRAVPNMRQHKLSLTWKGPYVVDRIYANHNLRLRSLIQDMTFITHVTRARIYRNIDHDLRQDMSAMKLTAEHNNCIPYVVAQHRAGSDGLRVGESQLQLGCRLAQHGMGCGLGCGIARAGLRLGQD
jgi:hypothetical protein